MHSRSRRRCTGGWGRGSTSRSSSCARTPRSWVSLTISSSTFLRSRSRGKKELFDEISMILEHEELSPGQAGKLRGKLMFGASQLWGKIGRAFLRALSDRQYSRKTADTALTPALLYSLYKWRTLVTHGPPRPIPGSGSRRTDVVIFTDGSAPSANPKDPATEMIGGVMFTRED